MGHDLWVCTLTIYELNDKMDLPGSDEVPSLKLTANAPENGWLEYDPFLLGFGLFSGAFAVSFREGIFLKQRIDVFFVFTSSSLQLHKFVSCNVFVG